MKILIGLFLGALIGGVIGYKGRCATGACPLTSNPYIGAMYGGLLGALLMGVPAGSSSGNADNSNGKEDIAMATTNELVVNLGKEESFESVVLKSEVPVLVDLWAPWCGPCRMQAPALEELASEAGDRARVVKVNVDDHQALAGELGVQSIPTLIVYKNGEESQRFVGVQSKNKLKEALGI